MKYICALIAVADVAKSRHFYEEILGQKVMDDLGENVSFEGSFSIHRKGLFQETLGAASHAPV